MLAILNGYESRVSPGAANSPLLRCERPADWIRNGPRRFGAVAAKAPLLGVNKKTDRKKMDESVQKSCWGLTAKAVIGFAGIILLAWLFSGGDSIAVLAAS